ncbi:MAG: DUF1329 domain-containing protein [Desulfuromonadaceae bacterium]|nr:DUF1329 domain-containing protein [Desulfuromonadaceae bacterium]
MKVATSIIAAGMALALAGTVIGAVSPEEAKKLGTTLTPIGAEKAGNKDGSIPEYTGAPAAATQKKGKISHKDPFADEKPIFSITSKNVTQYSDKLTEGAKALLKKYPTYRVDVYKTHRTTALPKWVNDATIKNVGKASTVNDGLAIKNAHAFYPFPIPKTGSEAMWNHLLVYSPNEIHKAEAYTVDANGRSVLTADYTVTLEFPYWDTSKSNVDYFFQVSQKYKGPARRSGEALMLMEPINSSENQRKAWQYLPGQRRVKLAPDVSHDAPEPATSGATTFDDNMLFSGSMERFNWKLVGKKEMYVPYNNYKMAYHSTPEELFKKGHLNPDFVRWELHRVWVVEATLKPGKRHIYHKRIFYLDEDCWNASASDQYDARGQLYRVGFSYMTPILEYPSQNNQPLGHYDLITGQYNLNGYSPKGSTEIYGKLPEREWSPDALSGSGVR